MKKALLSLVILLLFFLTASEVYATRFLGSYEKVIKIYDLPNTEDYTSTDGKLFDFGYKYTLYNVFFLPVFEKGEGDIVGYIDDDNYVLLSDDDIQNLAKSNDIKDLLSLVNIPYWDIWGGKIVVITIVILIWLILRYRNINIEKRKGL